MLKFKTYICLALSILTLQVAYGQTADVQKGCAPLRVKFNAPSAGAYLWDFKDDASSSLQGPTHIFVEPGTYDVELRNPQSGEIVGIVLIDVFEKPDLSFVADQPTGCAPLLTTFTDNTNYPSGFPTPSYLWTFGTTIPNSNVASPTVTYEEVGNFNVGLAIDSDLRGCDAVTRVGGFISTTSQANLNISTDPSTTSACDAPFQLRFINGTANPNRFDWNWDFGNDTTSTLSTPNPIVYEEGAFTVVVKATDSLACTTTESFAVNVGPPVIAASIPEEVCLNEAFSVSTAEVSGATYLWESAGAAFTTPTGPNTDIAYNTAGTKSLTLTISTLGGSCSRDTTVSINVVEVNTSISLQPTFGCTDSLILEYSATGDEAFTYDWLIDSIERTGQSGIDTILIPDNQVYSINEEQFIPIELAVTTGQCKVSLTDSITIQKPNAQFEVDTSFGCTPLTVNLSDKSIAHEAFSNFEILDNGESLVSSATFPESIMLSDTGLRAVELVVTTISGCIDTSYAVFIGVGDKLQSDFEVAQAADCQGDSLILTALNPSSFIDEFKFITPTGLADHCSTSDSSFAFIDTLQGAADFQLITGQYGCYDTLSKSVTIEARGAVPQIDYMVDCEELLNVEFINNSYGGNVVWTIEDSTITEDEFTFNFETYGEKKIFIEVQAADSGCEPVMDSLVLVLDTVTASFVELDSFLCPGEVSLDASASTFVNNTVWRGFKWERTWDRPIHTEEEELSMNISTPGEHRLDLIVFDRYGCTDTVSQEFEVFQPTANFTFDPDEICLPMDVQFTDASSSDTTIVSWEWTFGEAGMSMEQNPSFTFGGLNSDPTATLKIEDAVGCTGEIALTVPVYEVTSTINWTPAKGGFCVGEVIDFTATDFTDKGSFLTDWSWDFDNGETRTTQNVDGFTFDEAGEYLINLEFEEDATGCRGETQALIQVQDFPVADFAVDSLQCFNIPVDFTSNIGEDDGIGIFWDFGNGDVGVSAMASQIYPDRGTYTATLNAVTSFGCADTSMQMFRVAQPTGDFEIDQDTICRDGDITVNLIDTTDATGFVFDFNTGDVASESPFTYTYDVAAPATDGTITLRVNDGDECFDVVQRNFSFYDVTADFNNATTAPFTCLTKNIRFLNNSRNATDITWTFEDGTETDNEVIRTFDGSQQSTEVSLMVSNSQFGCTDMVTRTVEMPDPALVVAQLNRTLVNQTCQTQTYRFEAFEQDGNVYNWDFGNGETASTSSAEIQFGVGNFTPTLSVTNPENGCSDQAQTSIDVSADGVQVNIDNTVNAFSPNGDGINDFVTFEVLNPADDPELRITEFSIYNRWGKQVFSEQSLTPGWDGEVSGNEAPIDAYQYLIIYQYADCPEERIKGDFMIVK